MTYWDGDGMSGRCYGLMAVGMLVLWGLVIAAGAMFLRRYLRLQRAVYAPQTPEKELAGRFAPGGISHHEFVRQQDAVRGQMSSQLESDATRRSARLPRSRNQSLGDVNARD